MRSALTEKLQCNLLQLLQYLHCTPIYTAKNKKHTGTQAATQSNLNSDKAGARSEEKITSDDQEVSLCLFYIFSFPF